MVDFELFQGKLRDDLAAIKHSQQDILEQLARLNSAKPATSALTGYITAQEFMNAVHIRRWKFNELIGANRIKTIKKKRRIYVPLTEVDRFFNDPSVR